MGYYTDFKINIEPSLSKRDDLMKFFRTFENEAFDNLSVQDIPKKILKGENLNISELILYGRKWYDWEEEMTAFSVLLPEHFFTITGFGEENGDIWRAYIKNGKIQLTEAKIIFEEFDEGKML